MYLLFARSLLFLDPEDLTLGEMGFKMMATYT